MLFTPIYIAMTFMKTWRIRSFRARLLEFLNGNTSVAFCKVPENAAETPTLSSKLCTNPKNAYLCDLLDYTNATRICSMKPTQCIEISDWVSCSGGLPLGSGDQSPETELDVEVLFECEMDPHASACYEDIMHLENIGQPVAWKAGSHLAIVVKTNMENLSMMGFNFVGGEFVIDHKLPVVRIQTVQLSGEPNKATDLSMRGLRSEIQHALRETPSQLQWLEHAALLRKLSKVVDANADRKNAIGMNGTSDIHLDTSTVRRPVTLADVSVNTTKSLTEDDQPDSQNDDEEQRSLEKSDDEERTVVLENVTVEIQHNITPKKSSLKLDLKKGTSELSTSLVNISSQIKSVTTHKRVVSTTAPKKANPLGRIEAGSCIREDRQLPTIQFGVPKSIKGGRPLVNTKSPNVLIYSDSVVARDNLESTLRKVLDIDRYVIYSVSRETLEAGAWRGRAALVAVAGCVGRVAPLLLAHLLDGGRLLALCSDLLHTVLPYYKTAEVRENEVVQFSFDKWQSVKMKHHIFCYQASPAKKQFSTESDRQSSKYTGHPGHELAIEVLASEETWRTPSLLQATDLTNKGVAIFSQVHLEADPAEYLGEEGIASNEARLLILHKILGEVLGLHVQDPDRDALDDLDFTVGYFLGNHVDKLSAIEGWCGGGGGGGGGGGKMRVQELGDFTVHWCLRDEQPVGPPSACFLPVFVYECPENFSTVEYFDNLTSTDLGRLVVYADVVASTMGIIAAPLGHGVAAVARRQIKGMGRNRNKWITPPGQAAMSLQVWKRWNPCLTLVQHAAALAAVLAVRAQPGYDELDIRIKWPNDIYFGREAKIGGTITLANCLETDDVFLNIGTAVNICNAAPTTCVNAVIDAHNATTAGSAARLAPLSVEKFLARYCSQLERLIDVISGDGGVDAFREQYYQYWLHSGEQIRLRPKVDEDELGEAIYGEPVEGVISGVDTHGWLLVRTEGGERRVCPDGNTFDLMQGLILPLNEEHYLPVFSSI